MLIAGSGYQGCVASSCEKKVYWGLAIAMTFITSIHLSCIQCIDPRSLLSKHKIRIDLPRLWFHNVVTRGVTLPLKIKISSSTYIHTYINMYMQKTKEFLKSDSI